MNPFQWAVCSDVPMTSHTSSMPHSRTYPVRRTRTSPRGGQYRDEGRLVMIPSWTGGGPRARAILKPMNARFTVVVLAIGAGSGTDPQGSVASEVLEILAAHRAADIDPEGAWIDERGAWILFVARDPDSDHWILRGEFLQSAMKRGQTSQAAPVEFNTSGELSGGVLSLESPLLGSSRLHLCRFGRKELLLPEANVRFEVDSIPSGLVFKRLDGARTSGEFPRTVEEPFPAGTWLAVDGPEWAWLEIRQNGVEGQNWVRCCRRQEADVDNEFSLATWRDDVMELDSPLFGSTAWSLRRVGEWDWLVPAVPGDQESRIRFRLVNRASRSVGPPTGYMDIPDQEEIRVLEEF